MKETICIIENGTARYEERELPKDYEPPEPETRPISDLEKRVKALEVKAGITND